MELRSITPSLLLTLFLPHLLSAAVSSSSSSSAPFSSSLPPSPSPAASRPPLSPHLVTPPKQLEFDRPPFSGFPPRNTPSPRRRRPQRSATRKSPGKPKLNFGEELGLLFVGVAAALQVLFGTLLVYKRIQLKKVQRREQCDMASSSGLST